MYAIQSKAQNKDVVQELLARSAQVNEQTVTGMTALLLAAQKKHAGIIKMLLDNGADIWFQGSDNQNTVLHMSVKEGDIASIATILEYCKTQLTSATTRELLHLKNKQGLNILQLAQKECDAKTKENNRQQIFQLLREQDEAHQQKIDDDIKPLLKLEESKKAMAKVSGVKKHHSAQTVSEASIQVEGAELNEPNTTKTKKEKDRKNRDGQAKMQQEMQESLKASPDPAAAQKSPESLQENSPESGNAKKAQSKNQAKKESSNKKKKDKQKSSRETPSVVAESRVSDEEDIK